MGKTIETSSGNLPNAAYYFSHDCDFQEFDGGQEVDGRQRQDNMPLLPPLKN